MYGNALTVIEGPGYAKSPADVNVHAATLHNNIGDCLVALGNDTAALVHFSAAKARAPANTQVSCVAAFNLGALKQKAGLADEARGLFEEALACGKNARFDQGVQAAQDGLRSIK